MTTNTEERKSVGHICWLAQFEYWIGRDGYLYRAPITNTFDYEGYRYGRSEAPPHLVDETIALHRELLAQFERR